MKKIIDFLIDPFFEVSFGFISFCYFLALLILHDGFDFKSCFFGYFLARSLDIFGLGFNALVDQYRSKNNRQDPDDSN